MTKAIIPASESQISTCGNLVQRHLEEFTSIHSTLKLSAQKLLLMRFRAGVALLSIKKTLKHGEFVPFCKEHIIDKGIASNGALHNYINYAEALIAFPQVGAAVEKHLLADGTFPDEAAPVIEEAIHEIADGKDITGLMRTLGVIRDKKPNEHHPRKPVDVAATEEELDQVANEDWLAINGSILIHEKSLQRVTPENLDILHDTMVRVSKQIADLQKANKKKRKTKGKEAEGPATRSARAKAALRKGAQAR